MSSSRLSDSVEIRSLPAARGLHWLDAVHPPTVPAPAAAAAFAANDNSSSELTPNAARASSPKPEQQTTPAGKQRTQQELCGASPIAVEDEAATDISDGTPPTAAALTLKFQRIAAAAKERTPEAAKPPRPTSLATRVSRQVAKGGYASRLEASKNSSTRTTGAGVQDYRGALVSAVLDSPAPATTTTTNPSKCVEERSPETEDGCDDDMESECRQEIPQPVARSPFHDSSRHVAQHSSFSSAIVQALSQSEGAAILSMSQASYLSHLPAKDSDARDGMPVDAQSRRALALYDDAIRSKMAKEHWASLERARQELLEEARLARDCPFQPQVSAYAAKIKRPAELRPENRAKAELLRRTQWIAMRQQEEVLKELESCTFRPLTLRAVELNPEALQINPEIFAELYHEAQEKHHFETVIRPQVVEQLERRRAHGDFALPMEKVQEVVDRLFTRAVTISAANAEELARVHANRGKPELSAETQRIIERQIHKGERDSDVVSNLYQVRRGPSLDALLDERIRLGEERMAQALRAQESEKERQRLERQRIRTVLAAKFRALARRVCTARRQVFRPGMSYSIVDIAKAALDVLLPKEAEELLGAVEHCGMEKLNEASFIVLILRYAQDRYAEHNQQCAILLEPPPANTIASQKRMERSGGDASASYTGQQSTSSFRRIKREKADPELLERAKAKREERKEQWRQEALRRERGEMEDEEAVELTFKPAPRRLIPYECRPDVVVEVKTTKADALRRAHIREKQRALHEAPDPLAVPDFVATLGVPLSETRGPSSTRQPPTSRVLFSHDRNSSNPAPDKSHRRYSSPDSAAMAEEDDGPRGDADGRRRGATHSAAATSLSSPHRSSYGRQRSSPPPELNDEAARRRARGSGTIMPSSMSRDAPTQPNAAARSPPSASHLTRARGERLYRDVISEHGAFGGEEALAHLGRELLMRQLRDFQEQRAGSRSP